MFAYIIPLSITTLAALPDILNFNIHYVLLVVILFASLGFHSLIQIYFHNTYFVCSCLHAQSCLFAILWTVPSHTPLSMGFSMQEYRSGRWGSGVGCVVLCTVNICLRCACCTPRKPSSSDRGSDKSQRPPSPNTQSPELLGPGKGTKWRPNWVCTSEDYLSTWTWAA